MLQEEQISYAIQGCVFEVYRQLLNYLKATGLHLGMLVNFAFPKASVKRVVL